MKVSKVDKTTNKKTLLEKLWVLVWGSEWPPLYCTQKLAIFFIPVAYKKYSDAGNGKLKSCFALIIST